MTGPRRIRVLFVVDFLLSLSGGTERQLLALINNLDATRFEPHLLVLRRTDWLAANASRLRCPVRVVHIAKLKNPVHALRFVSALAAIRAVRPDVVMTFFPLADIAGVLLAAAARVPAIVSTRRDYGLWLQRRGLFLLRFANRFVRRIIVNSRAVGEVVREAEGVDEARIDVVYNGLALPPAPPDPALVAALRERLGLPEGEPVVGIVGGLKPMKHHETLLRAAPRILERRPGTRFVLVGDGVRRAALEDLAGQLGVSERVVFAGDQGDVRPFLALFDVGVNCSANEGLSNAVMEYMASGVPCVVSAAGGNGELIADGHNGYTYRLDDAGALADRVLELLADPELAGRFRERARDGIRERFSLDVMVREYERRFAAFAREGRGGP